MRQLLEATLVVVLIASVPARGFSQDRQGEMASDYAGTCEEAFRFYEQHLGGRITGMVRHRPEFGSKVPENWQNAILHARIEIGNMVLMGADIPGAEPMRSAYLTLTLNSAEEAERLYELLSEGGEVFMKMEETAFASRFAQLRDRFGTSWMLLHERKAT